MKINESKRTRALSALKNSSIILKATVSLMLFIFYLSFTELTFGIASVAN